MLIVRNFLFAFISRSRKSSSNSDDLSGKIEIPFDQVYLKMNIPTKFQNFCIFWSIFWLTAAIHPTFQMKEKRMPINLSAHKINMLKTALNMQIFYSKSKEFFVRPVYTQIQIPTHGLLKMEKENPGFIDNINNAPNKRKPILFHEQTT